MKGHLAGFFESIDSATLTPLNVISDDILTVAGARRFLTDSISRYIYWAAALGNNVTRAQIRTPSLSVRQQTQEIVPRERGTTAFTLGGARIYVPTRPIELDASENLEVQAAEDAAGASTVYSLIMTGDAQLDPMAEGDVRVVRATGTTTLTANVWTTVPLTTDEQFEPGIYQLVGFIPISATGIAARAVIPGQQYRPGMPVLAGAESAAVDFIGTEIFNLMGWNMGQFSHIQIPQMQFLASAGDTAQTVFLFVVRIGDFA